MAEQFQNFYTTTLREACSADATTIYVETPPSITEGTLVINHHHPVNCEIIHFTGVSGRGLLGCTRGLEGTIAQAHSPGSDIRQNLTAGMIDKLINGVITTENIADGAITSAKLANKAVKSNNIDWATFATNKFPAVIANTANNNVNSDAWSEQWQYTVPENGIYLVMFSQQLTTGEDSKDLRVSIAVDDGGGEKEKAFNVSGGLTYTKYIQATAFCAFEAKKGWIIKARSRGGGTGSYKTRYGKAMVVRIW